MEDQKRENRIGSASKVIIAVTELSIIIIHVAPILLLVDPIDDMLTAMF